MAKTAPKTPHTSTLLAGSIVEFREDGEWHPYEITDDYTTWHTGVCMDTVPQGTKIYRCVWKDRGTRLEVRSTRIKKTPATKTVAQWEAECQEAYEKHIAWQMETRKKFDAVVASMKDENDPVELMQKLLGAAMKGNL